MSDDDELATVEWAAGLKGARETGFVDGHYIDFDAGGGKRLSIYTSMHTPWRLSFTDEDGDCAIIADAPLTRARFRALQVGLGVPHA